MHLKTQTGPTGRAGWRESLSTSEHEGKFVTAKISEAAYLMGPCQAKLLFAGKDPNGRFRIVLDINEEQGSLLLSNFPTSESRVFDDCVKFLKGVLCRRK
jgi:hypothetical protein